MNTIPPHAHGSNIPSTSGIYKITCIANKKIYIGSAVNLRNRQGAHLSNLLRNKHVNLHLQSAWNKYGEQAFTFEVVELVLPISLTAREQYWLNKLKPFGRKGFNILSEAGSPLGKKLTLETREKISLTHFGKKASPESRKKMSQSALDRGFSSEAIEAMRQANLGKKHSLESREKMRQAHLGKKVSPAAIEKNRQAQLGKKLSPEHIERIRQAKLRKTK